MISQSLFPIEAVEANWGGQSGQAHCAAGGELSGLADAQGAGACGRTTGSWLEIVLGVANGVSAGGWCCLTSSGLATGRGWALIFSWQKLGFQVAEPWGCVSSTEAHTELPTEKGYSQPEWVRQGATGRAGGGLREGGVRDQRTRRLTRDLTGVFCHLKAVVEKMETDSSQRCTVKMQEEWSWLAEKQILV